MAWRTTASAEEDIAALAAFGGIRYGGQRAAAYLSDLFDTFDLLADNPYLARIREELRTRPRLYRYRAHNIFYTIDNEDVLVLRVLSNRQDWLHQL